MKIFLIAVALAALILGTTSHALDSVNGDLSVTSWTRNIDLSSQLVKTVHVIKYSNGGAGPVKSVHFTMDEKEAKFVSFIGATVKKCLFSH